MEPTGRQKRHIATLNIPNFDQLSEPDQEEKIAIEIKKIDRFPLIKNPHSIRFRDLDVQLTNLLKCMPIFQQLWLEDIPERALAEPYRFLNWDLCKAVKIITSYLITHIDFFESSKELAIPYFVDRWLDILQFALQRDTNRSTVTTWLNRLKERLVYIMIEFITGFDVEKPGADGARWTKCPHIHSRCENMHLVARFLSYETSNMKVIVKKIKPRIQYLNTNLKSHIHIQI